MLGRTHGQPGLPITFGFKAALWAAEVRRHLRADRAGRAAARGRPARAARSGRCPRSASWARSCSAACWRGSGSASRTQLADGARPDRRVRLRCWRSITGTLAKIGNEVYNLQRAGDRRAVARRRPQGVVGSITMPQKRNPERSEHLVDARARRARRRRRSRSRAWSASTSATARRGRPSGRSCPQACARDARPRWRSRASWSGGLRVDAARMRANLDAQRGYVLAEPAMLALAARVGKHRAHELVHRAALARAGGGGDARRRRSRRTPEIAAAALAAGRVCCGRERRARRRGRRRSTRSWPVTEPA